MKHKLSCLLFFGYPSELPPLGPVIWIKRIADIIELKKVFQIIKIDNDRTACRMISNDNIIRKKIRCFLYDLEDVIDALGKCVDVAILSGHIQAVIMLWCLLRILKPKTKVIIVFHHHEPLPVVDTGHVLYYVDMLYLKIMEKLTKLMLKDVECILTVSKSSAEEICSLYDEKNMMINIAIVGCGIDKLDATETDVKEIDFLSVGRFEKFDGIEVIWKLILEKEPMARFVIIGRADESVKKHLTDLKIEHKGIVSDEEKIKLYANSKVFILPSSREGFGIALAEAIHIGIPSVAWRLPVFDELYSNSDSILRLIEPKNYKLFAEEAIKLLKLGETVRIGKPFVTWEEVAEKVTNVLQDVIGKGLAQ